MKKVIALLLCAGMVFSFSACNNSNNNNNGENTVQDSSLQEEDNVQDNSDEAELPAEAESMLFAIEALIQTDVQTHLEYGVWNTDFVWTACNNLTLLLAQDAVAPKEIAVESTIESSDMVKQCMNAMFAGFNGNKQELPEVTIDSVTYNETDDTYEFTLNPFDAHYLKVTSCGADDVGALDVVVELYYYNNDIPEGAYHVIMEETTYTSSDEVLFNYMITSFEEVNPQVVPGEGEISEEEALALVEQLYGEGGQADAETGNIITYSLESLENLDGTTYYNFRMAWLVMNEDGVPDHSSYLNNVFVSLDGSEILDVSMNSDGVWEVVED